MLGQRVEVVSSGEASFKLGGLVVPSETVENTSGKVSDFLVSDRRSLSVGETEFLDWSYSQHKSISCVLSCIKELSSGSIGLFPQDKASHLDAVQQQMFQNGALERLFVVEDLSPFQDFFNIVLNSGGARLDAVFQLHFDLGHQLSSFDKTMVVEQLDFDLDVINNLKTALITVFDFCELIITDEFIKETSDKLSLW